MQTEGREDLTDEETKPILYWIAMYDRLQEVKPTSPVLVEYRTDYLLFSEVLACKPSGDKA